MWTSSNATYHIAGQIMKKVFCSVVQRRLDRRQQAVQPKARIIAEHHIRIRCINNLSPTGMKESGISVFIPPDFYILQKKERGSRRKPPRTAHLLVGWQRTRSRCVAWWCRAISGGICWVAENMVSEFSPHADGDKSLNAPCTMWRRRCTAL